MALLRADLFYEEHFINWFGALTTILGGKWPRLPILPAYRIVYSCVQVFLILALRTAKRE